MIWQSQYFIILICIVFTLCPKYSPKSKTRWDQRMCGDHECSLGAIFAWINSYYTAQSEVGRSIDLQYMEHPADWHLLAAATRQGLELATTAPLSEVLDKVILPSEPLSTDKKYLEFDRQTLGSFSHQIDTCSIMPLEDGGVVNSNLIIYDTKNLQIVDISILPLYFSSNIQ